jgi:hypothetical protein
MKCEPPGYAEPMFLYGIIEVFEWRFLGSPSELRERDEVSRILDGRGLPIHF